MKVSIGICAYNEEKNIGKLLEALASEELIGQIVVVASGCTDNTVKIAQSFEGNKNFVMVVDNERRGKAVAINQFINTARQNINGFYPDVLIIESADTIPSPCAFKHLLNPLIADERIGMVGARPIPMNQKDTRMGRIGHLLWESHHQMSLIKPKAGEVCAFRNVIERINPDTAVDEASIQAQLVWQGYKIVYAPRAVIWNKAPETKEDFIKQRKRIYHGHLKLKAETGYEVPSLSLRTVIKATLKAGRQEKLIRSIGYAAWLELYSRFQANKAMGNGYNSTIWEISKSTKELSK